MKYTQDYCPDRSVDGRLLGQMLGGCDPINADYRRGTRNRGCSSTRQSTPRYTGTGGCCERNLEVRREDGHYDDARLGSACAQSPSLAMAYTPFQYFHEIYSAQDALDRGTLFLELDKPWRV